MLRSVLFVWLFALFSAIAFAQTGPPASICDDNPDLPGCTSSTTSSKTTSTKTNDVATTGTTEAASTGGGGAGGGQTASDVSATAAVVSGTATQTANSQANPSVGAS